MRSGEDIGAGPASHASHDQAVPDRPGGHWPTSFCGMPFSTVDAVAVLDFLERRRSSDAFAYVVTPNVDHVVRAWREGRTFQPLYAEADLSLCDSRVLSLCGRAAGVRLPVVTGSDLTRIMFELVLNPYERVTIVGGEDGLVARLKRRYGLRNVRHHNPPMGFIRDRAATMEAVAFLERAPSRFVFLAVGSPQQEMLANIVKRRGVATGTALCVGASLLFLTGDLQRAPVWMQRSRIEWLHRLLQEPRRLWRRYLLEGPQILRLAVQDRRLKDRQAEHNVQISIVVPTFRREHLLSRLLERCAGQGGLGPQALEIIVVDNTPEATARALVEAAARRSPVSIRYLHEPAPGISHARNRGVAAARGDLVAFIDDDEVPSPEWLELLLVTQRTYKADVVLGPVRPVFEAAPRTFLKTFRAFFSQTSDAPTGTAVNLHSPFRLRRGGGCDRPLASNNALLVKARCFPGAEPFDPALGLTGGEDTLFFSKLHRKGRRFIWCKEALVHERIPKERLTKRFMLKRKFRDGQITSSTCLLLDRPAYGELAGWVAIGAAQFGLGGLVGVLALPLNRQLALKGLCMAATGCGKVLFTRRFRRRSYGGQGVALRPAGT